MVKASCKEEAVDRQHVRQRVLIIIPTKGPRAAVLKHAGNLLEAVTAVALRYVCLSLGLIVPC